MFLNMERFFAAASPSIQRVEAHEGGDQQDKRGGGSDARNVAGHETSAFGRRPYQNKKTVVAFTFSFHQFFIFLH